ncbi:SRPBCC domain-containing protein [Pontibacter silvestris]|uniref:SRPBCC domain-containing protein n=1 Tax=Pontibacter silvestris TaxID=2305183 RepID=A0ABW4WZJ0_9BACT|nr:SRPBCC family protein [Pontibacter silvestris]MCC9138963.1 SRPBCC domain-containing protein [Pontibacter silvestris]
MYKNLVASSNIKMRSTPEKLWRVLTDPEKIKEYLFGTKVQTDWKVGSQILFQGEYDGQQYTDKGNVTERKVNELLKYDYWSGFSGLEDKPENYSLVTYRIEKLNDNEVKFTWHQQGFSSETGQKHTEEGLKGMLKKIKELAEK